MNNNRGKTKHRAFSNYYETQKSTITYRRWGKQNTHKDNCIAASSVCVSKHKGKEDAKQGKRIYPQRSQSSAGARAIAIYEMCFFLFVFLILIRIYICLFCYIMRNICFVSRTDTGKRGAKQCKSSLKTNSLVHIYKTINLVYWADPPLLLCLCVSIVDRRQCVKVEERNKQ